MSSTNKSNSTTQVLGFIIFIFFILFAYKYFITNYSFSYTDSSNVENKPDIKVRCPPIKSNSTTLQKKENNYVSDKSIVMHKNDLHIVDNRIPLYNEHVDMVDNPGFENELGNNTDIDKTLTSELDQIYLETSKLDQDIYDNKYSNSCSYSKPHKSDLPIVNIPAFLLTQEKSVRLSDIPL